MSRESGRRDLSLSREEERAEELTRNENFLLREKEKEGGKEGRRGFPPPPYARMCW